MVSSDKRYPFLYCIIFLLMTGCARHPSQSGDLVISMRKTACYGNCPVYSVEIYNNLKIKYTGNENVPLTGSHESEISRRRFSNLVQSFVDANFFEFENDYMEHVTDLPTTFIEFNHENNSKKIRDYYGAPESLKDLEKRVEELVKLVFWEDN